MNTEYTDLSFEYMNTTDVAHRKRFGQYFTPRSICEGLIANIPHKHKMKILDPACGGGDFLVACNNIFKDASLDGFEIEPTLAAISKKNIKNASIKCVDALEQIPTPRYDLVIGNPPYFEFKPDKEVRTKYQDVISGRVNIFSIFIHIGLSYLKDGGYLAFILPSSMNNGAYFSKLREYILSNTSIEYLNIVDSADSFHKAQQQVMMLILKKGETSDKYVFRHEGLTLFSQNYEYLEHYYRDKCSLRSLGYRVKTGSVVWNEHKDKLSACNMDGAKILIRSKNIVGSQIIVSSDCHMQYINTMKSDASPAIVVNRITGGCKQLSIKSAIVSPNFNYVGENHVNIIYYNEEGKLENTNYPLSYIQTCLQNSDNISVMRDIIGNTQISKTELERLFPIPFI